MLQYIHRRTAAPPPRGMSGFGAWTDPTTGTTYTTEPWAVAGDYHTIDVVNGTNAWIDAQLATGKLNSAQSAYLQSMRRSTDYNQRRLAQPYITDGMRAWGSANRDNLNDPTKASGIEHTVADDIALRIRDLTAVVNAYAGSDGLKLYEQAQQTIAQQQAASAATAAAIDAAIKAGTQYTLPGAAPLPAQYQYSNLPVQTIGTSSSSSTTATPAATTPGTALTSATNFAGIPVWGWAAGAVVLLAFAWPKGGK